MTHELKLLFDTLKNWQQQGKKAVFVSVVDLEGSSYRRPGVRMLICEDGEYAGAVSGGCVESEIERQAQSVFRTNTPKVITYDGRYRIGCEGVIYVLIEPVLLSEALLGAFESQLKSRRAFEMNSFFYSEVGEYDKIGSVLNFNGTEYSLNPDFKSDETDNQKCFSQTFEPLFQLFIFGAEHDAVQLSQAAKLLGWKVTIIASPEESKSCDYFPGAASLLTPSFDDIDTSAIDEQTAVVLMTHSFNKDVQYLMALKEINPAYIGLLGSVNRRERVISMLLEQIPDLSLEFIEQIHGPAGINIGAENAAEISVSILAEILSVVRKQKPLALREKVGAIHE
ncbi:XdhC family protein [Draconibacterium halophilum]|uniref:XdhC family protein n=1 Tax=Draconibacterium halophilum TaxID=2706887 RepID=A0A6C0RBB7_9BACT|nr:XdhC/CoxI family protein [Draconibacterium halophilum]QIA07938.1 XdhC family protein [Draconibacterium halophilum]